MITNREELRELRARALCKAMLGTGDIEQHFRPDSSTREMWVSLAEATMKAEEAAGIASVPLIPTSDMESAGSEGASVAGYSACTSAAHFILNAGNNAGNLLKGE